MFPARPLQTDLRNHWEVALSLDEEGPGPWLVDLCHQPRWDLQDGRVGDMQPGGLAVPEAPGACRLENQLLINRMNGTQAALWHLGSEEAPVLPDAAGYTDVTDATLFLALFGPRIFEVTEHLTNLDFGNPQRRTPFLLQGPLAHVPCQAVVLARGEDGSGGVLLTCSRGYAQDMVQAVLSAGAAHGLRPAGENRFMTWLAELEKHPGPNNRQ
jgi:hypothetical protein